MQLQRYYWTRARHQDLFDRLLPSAQERVLQHGLQLVLPERDRNGCRVFVFRPGERPADGGGVRYLPRGTILLFGRVCVSNMICLV